MHAWTAGRRRGYAWGMRAIKNQQVHQKKKKHHNRENRDHEATQEDKRRKQCMEQVPRERENKKRE
jgi:hypothetical protein